MIGQRGLGLRRISGVFVPGHNEVQVLDSYGNETYADGQAAAVYGKYVPLANVCRKPGEWQTYDVIWRAPVFGSDGALVKPARVTLLLGAGHEREALLQKLLAKKEAD